MPLQVTHHQIDPSLVSPLEYQTLQEYAKLLTLLRNLLDQIYKLKNLNSQQLLDNLRILETKLTLVFTLFKGSVYSLFLQTKMNMGNGNINNNLNNNGSNGNNINDNDDDDDNNNNVDNENGYNSQDLKEDNGLETSSSINSGY